MSDNQSDNSAIPKAGIIGNIVIFIDIDGIKKVKKSYDNYDMLQSEAASLLQIKSYGLNVPTIYSLTENPNELIMEYIEHDESPNKELLLDGINQLHKVKNENFGNDRDGYFLKLKVSNNKSNNWCEWWTLNRWDVLTNLLENSDKELMIFIRNLIPLIFSNYQITPSLIHGDFNKGNILVQKDTQKIYFIDSQCYFGDPHFELLQFKTHATNFNNIDNTVDLLYLSFLYGSIHRTISSKNSYLWRSRICMNKIIDKLNPLWPSVQVKYKKLSYQYLILICGNDIFKKLPIDILNIIRTFNEYCSIKYSCNKQNILCVFFKTNDWMHMKKNKYGNLVFERLNDVNLQFYEKSIKDLDFECSSSNICIDNSNYWSGSDIVNRYKTILPNLKETYVLCSQYNSTHYKQCFSDKQLFLVLDSVTESTKKQHRSFI